MRSSPAENIIKVAINWIAYQPRSQCIEFTVKGKVRSLSNHQLQAVGNCRTALWNWDLMPATALLLIMISSDSSKMRCRLEFNGKVPVTVWCSQHPSYGWWAPVPDLQPVCVYCAVCKLHILHRIRCCFSKQPFSQCWGTSGGIFTKLFTVTFCCNVCVSSVWPEFFLPRSAFESHT